MYESLQREDFIAEFNSYIASTDDEAISSALALYAFDNALDSASASSPVNREARRMMLEKLSMWARDARAAGDLEPYADAEVTDPDGELQRTHPNWGEVVLESWGSRENTP